MISYNGLHYNYVSEYSVKNKYGKQKVNGEIPYNYKIRLKKSMFFRDTKISHIVPTHTNQ